MSRLCPPCAASYDGWRHYRLAGPIPRWRMDPPGPDGAAHYAQMSMDLRRTLIEERRALADWQCDFIRRLCAEQHMTEAEAA